MTIHKVTDVKKVRHHKLKEDSTTLKHCKRDPSFPDQWLCKYCSKPLGVIAANLGQHLKVKHQIIMSDYFDRRFFCSYCPKSFTRSDNRKFHEETVHLKNMPGTSIAKCQEQLELNKITKPFMCSYCGKGFSQKPAMTAHTRIHTGEKPYHCEECSKSFTYHSSYAEHMKRHDPKYEKPEQRKKACSICGKEVVNIHCHMRFHSEEKKCDLCDFKTKYVGNLRIHMKTHSN